ncbi:AAA family ATPase [Curtobacterium flaccumfaciens]|uniref:ATP-dependent nuclease n=1 Tax=Curtobacterium flaccumfaciens TaxID=2035 RepID=UPI00188C12A4|nr:AAA family ATPase [Curtobacterium flaccumfaciens]MBF4595323.1 AAA family ATPase [Curtobacterium flaccumfaciens]
MSAVRGFGFRNYRSYRGPHFTALILDKVNLVAGQNNSGKSNVLRAAIETLSPSRTRSSWDRHAASPDTASEFILLVGFDEFRDQTEIAANMDQIQLLAEDIRAVLNLPRHEADAIWLPIDPSAAAVDTPLVKELGRLIGPTEYSESLSAALTSTSGGNISADIERAIAYLINRRNYAAAAYNIDGSRAITSESNTANKLNGAGITRRLLELENPTSDQLQDRQRFLAIQRFAQNVLEDPDLTISIPHTAETIHVTQGSLTLPIEHMGTGVHEVVIIAAAATLHENSLFCLEEPELHLHPLLQRKLLRYLAEQTSNTYLIATHSAHMLDTGVGTISHVRYDGEQSRITTVGSAAEQAEVCEDLGYRPSDLVQTNAIIWVEGPSDRIYLQFWLDRVAPHRYREGLHYSIMFYGGGLLSALSPLDEPEVEEFISLRRLNRYTAILIDSDKRTPRMALNGSKRRVIEEFRSDPDRSLAWVTWGYTIENYIPPEILASAVRKAHPRKGSPHLSPAGRWENPLSIERVGTSPSKVAIAREVVSDWVSPLPATLEREVQLVLAMIAAANRHLS